MDSINNVNQSHLSGQIVNGLEKGAGTVAGTIMGTIWGGVGTLLIARNSITNEENVFTNLKEGSKLFGELSDNSEESGMTFGSPIIDSFGKAEFNAMSNVLGTVGKLGDLF